MNLCVFCDKSVEPNAETTWKEVRGFVGGRKKDSMVLRTDTGRNAHEECVNKARAGQAPDQPELFDEEAQAEPLREPVDMSWMDD